MFRKPIEQCANVNIRVKRPKEIAKRANGVVKVNDDNTEDRAMRLITII